MELYRSWKEIEVILWKDINRKNKKCWKVFLSIMVLSTYGWKYKTFTYLSVLSIQLYLHRPYFHEVYMFVKR